MGPKPSQPQTGELFRPRLDEQINMKHPLVRLAVLIDWAEIERAFAVSFTSGRGRPALPPRLVAGLLYLQHTFDASDEAVVNTWVENPYWQYFCGETYLQTELPIDPSSLTRWRKRVGEEGVETLLAASIDAARRGGVIRQVCSSAVRSWCGLACTVWRAGPSASQAHLSRVLPASSNRIMPGSAG